MGRWLIKFDEDRFLEWSSIVDAPITMMMTRKELEEHVRNFRGSEGLDRLAERIERAVGPETIGWNRAGPNERRLTAKEIEEQYTRRPTQRQSDHQEPK